MCKPSVLWITLLLSGRPLLADLPDAEPPRHFLRRPPLSAYTNYGEDLYRPYRREIRLAPRYDFLGRFLAEGFLVYELDEQRPGGSRIRKDRLYRSLNNLIIAHDSYGPWHWSLTVGDEVRTEFTPLTLRQAGFNGLRWDVVFPANKITLLTTRGFDSSLFPTLNSFSDPVAQGRGSLIDYLERTEENPVYNLAGHWQTRLGDVLRFGATFVNQHQANTARGSTGGFLSGGIPYPAMQPPSEITVRVRDDSPQSDEAGAIVYDIVLELEGEGPRGRRRSAATRLTTVLLRVCYRKCWVGGAAMALGRCAARRRWNICSSYRRILRRAGRGCGLWWPMITALRWHNSIPFSTRCAISSPRAIRPLRRGCGRLARCGIFPIGGPWNLNTALLPARRFLALTRRPPLSA